MSGGPLPQRLDRGGRAGLAAAGRKELRHVSSPWSYGQIVTETGGTFVGGQKAEEIFRRRAESLSQTDELLNLTNATSNCVLLSPEEGLRNLSGSFFLDSIANRPVEVPPGFLSVCASILLRSLLKPGERFSFDLFPSLVQCCLKLLSSTGLPLASVE